MIFTIRGLTDCGDACLKFGVPLEDLSTSDEEIHPYIAHVFNETYKAVIDSDRGIEYIISNMQGTVSDRMALKELIENCVPLRFNRLPGALLWIIRHFIGLLPIPLLPYYADGKYFDWKRLSEFCKLRLNRRNVDARLEYKTNGMLMQNLMRLPPANAIFLHHFLNFLRRLTRLPFDEAAIHRHSLLLLTRYFCCSLFLRPYHPGYLNTRDRDYIHLLFYLASTWPHLNRLQRKRSVEIRYERTLETVVEDESTETDEQCFKECEVHKLKSKRCCCNYGNNYGTELYSMANNQVQYGWVEPNDDESDDDNSNASIHLIKLETSNVPIEDDLYETVYEDAKSFKENETSLTTCRNNAAMLNSMNSNDLTFFSAKSFEKPTHSSKVFNDNQIGGQTSTPINGKLSSPNIQCQVNEDYCNIKEGINVDILRSNDYNQPVLECNSSNSSLPPKKSRPSLAKIRKIVSRIDVLNLFKKKPKAAENVQSKVKYKKMKCVQSNIF